jgi:hypothetical protein
MLGSSTILVLWILAAAPAGETVVSDAPLPDDQITRTSYEDRVAVSKDEPPGGELKKKDDVVPAPPALPADPAYEGKRAPSAEKQEGIPGLPPLLQESPTPPKAVPKHAGEVGETTVTDGAFDSRAERCYRCAGQGGWRGWLDGVTTDGWLDQGATLNTLSPRNRTNGPVTFNNRSNDYQLNQLYLLLKRDVDRQGCRWDAGGRIDLLYGTDSLYTSARGLELGDDLSPKWNAQQYGLSMPQAYAEFFCPWGNGLSVKLGHFYSILGYETAPAPANFFYSHSYVYQYGEPKTYTGLLAATHLGDFEIQAGMTRGWDNWGDNNNDMAFTGSIGWTSDDERTSIALGVDAGREQPDPTSNVRTLYSLVIQQKLGERWQYVAQFDYGNEPAAGVGDTIARWYGLNQYLFRTINEHWKAGLRFEWFRDENGSRIADVGQTADYFELTPGLNWTPDEHWTVRPELRWDWTGTAGVYPFGDGTRSSQLLLSCDVIARF